MCFVCAWKIGLFIRLLFWLSQCNCVRLSLKSWSSSNKVQNQEISLAPSKNDLYSTSILHKANVGWSLLVQDKVWWKEGVDEALHGWSKHHQQLKFAKRRNFWQLLVIWSLKLSFVAFVFMTFVFLLLWERWLFTIDNAYCVVRFFPWLHFLCYGYFSIGALISLSSNKAGWK
jgi:hypothetical protein